MFKVMLINSPERISWGGFKYYPPFSLLYLAAHLDANGIDVDIVDPKQEKTYIDTIKNRVFKRNQGITQSMLYAAVMKEIIDRAVASSPDLIGISCVTKEYKSVMKLAAALKEKVRAPIIVGGVHTSLYPEQFIFKGSPVDFIVIGEGEETLLELAKHLEAGRTDHERIDGIGFLKDGRCHLTQLRELNNDFSISPINVYRKINMKLYTRPNSYVARHVRIAGTQIFTSRGCPYRCTFCSNPLIWKMNKSFKPIRYRPVQSVIEEIKFLRDNYNIDGFYIMDDTFCIDKKRVEAFCAELKNNRINMVWGIETRANLVDEPILRTMKKTGLIQMDIGVESGSDDMLKEIKKGITVKDTLDIFSLAHKYKVRTFANMMVNLPNETIDDLKKTLRLIDQIRPSSGSLAVTVPLPKTELYNKYVASKMKDDLEIAELSSRDSNFYQISDERLHLCKYSIDFLELINRVIRKHYMFVELQLGGWYWKMFIRSKRKMEYLLSIAVGCLDVAERAINMNRYFRKKKKEGKKSSVADIV